MVSAGNRLSFPIFGFSAFEAPVVFCSRLWTKPVESWGESWGLPKKKLYGAKVRSASLSLSLSPKSSFSYFLIIILVFQFQFQRRQVPKIYTIMVAMIIRISFSCIHLWECL